jgi:hypothetical protein
MIAAAGYYKMRHGLHRGETLEVNANLPMRNWATA